MSANNYIEFSFTLDFGTDITKLTSLRASISAYGSTGQDDLAIHIATDINTHAPKRYLKVKVREV